MRYDALHINVLYRYVRYYVWEMNIKRIYQFKK